MKNNNKVLLLGHNGFVGSLLKEEQKNNFEYILISTLDLLDLHKENFIEKKIKESDLVIFLSFINSNRYENLMYQNSIIAKKILNFVKKDNKKFFFISSDSADHAMTPYGKSKIECEEIFSKLQQYWYIRPGPIYHDMKNIFKGALNILINSKRMVIPLPKRGNFKIKFLSIEKLTLIIEQILNDKVKKGKIQLSSQLLSEFLNCRNNKLLLVNMPKFFFILIKHMPKIFKNRLPLDLISIAYIE